MANISKVNVHGATYDIKDNTARQLISQIDPSAVIANPSAPSDTSKLWRSTLDNKLRYYNGTGWAELGSGGTLITSDDYLTNAEIEEIIGLDVYWDGTVE